MFIPPVEGMSFYPYFKGFLKNWYFGKSEQQNPSNCIILKQGKGKKLKIWDKPTHNRSIKPARYQPTI